MIRFFLVILALFGFMVACGGMVIAGSNWYHEIPSYRGLNPIPMIRVGFAMATGGVVSLACISAVSLFRSITRFNG